MLSSKYRFHSRGGVRYTYKNGQTIRAPKISLVYAKNSRSRQRFAVVVSKKVLKSAVGRNRIRRRIYEAIRTQLQEFKSPFDCIFIVYTSDIRSIPFDDLKIIVKSLLSETVL